LSFDNAVKITDLSGNGYEYAVEGYFSLYSMTINISSMPTSVGMVLQFSLPTADGVIFMA
jgi:hypothetical protein